MKKRKIYIQNEQFLEVVLMKTNFDTLGSINYISKILHKPAGFFGIAGTKVFLNSSSFLFFLNRIKEE